MNDTTESFISYEEHNVSISQYINNSTTCIMPQHEVYVNTISNIHDMDSLIEFYRLMFGGHPLVLVTCVFVGLYIGCMIIEKHQKHRQTGGEKK